MRRAILIGLALAVGLAGSASAQVVVNADIVTDTNWANCTLANPYILQKPIFVKNGATLRLPAGCVVRGQPRNNADLTDPNGAPGTLVVTQTGRLVAAGTATNPVIFTTAAIDDSPDDGICDNTVAPLAYCDRWTAGKKFLDDDPKGAPLAMLDKSPSSVANVKLWGGLVILGNAPTNLADRMPAGYGQGTVEGLAVPGFPIPDVTYGGVDPHDNSGSLRFVSIRHAGDELGAGNELNGLTLGGVGDGTVIENVEVYANFDDGFEWFGGTVHGKRLAVFFIGDDMFDIDQGYTGINQFLLGIQGWFNEDGGAPYGSASGDKGAEMDGDDWNHDTDTFDFNVNTRVAADGAAADDTQWPLSYPNLYNVTLLGPNLNQVDRNPGPVVGPEFTTTPSLTSFNKRGFQARNGFAGWIHNSIVVNTGTEEGFEVDAAANGSPGQQAVDHVNDGFLGVSCSTFDDTGALDATELLALENGDRLSEDMSGVVVPVLPAYANVVAAVAPTYGNAPVAFTNLTNEDQSFDPSGNGAGKLVAGLKQFPINPRPVGLAGTGGCVLQQFPGATGATYRGAFAVGAPQLWTDGWTALGLAGLLD